FPMPPNIIAPRQYGLTLMPVLPSVRYCIACAPVESKEVMVAEFARSRRHHHGIVMFSQRVNVPVGSSGPSSATRTTSREPSSTDCVPSYPLRFVLVKPGETKLTLIPVDSSSTIMASVILVFEIAAF